MKDKKIYKNKRINKKRKQQNQKEINLIPEDAHFREFIAETNSEVLTVGYGKARRILQDVWNEVIIAIKNYNP